MERFYDFNSGGGYEMRGHSFVKVLRELSDRRELKLPLDLTVLKRVRGLGTSKHSQRTKIPLRNLNFF